MRNDLIELLALLVSVGYIKSFRVTKTYSEVEKCRNKERNLKNKRKGMHG